MNISTVHFDISPDGKVCNGTLTLSEGILTKNLDGKEEKFNINDEIEVKIKILEEACGTAWGENFVNVSNFSSMIFAKRYSLRTSVAVSLN